MIIEQTIRVMVIMGAAFILAMFITPAWLKSLKDNKIGKQIRPSGKAPVYNSYHEKKAGTPTAGGVIIWGTVIGIAILIAFFDLVFGGSWSFYNFIDRRETYLPLAAFAIAAILGLMDDVLGSRGIGANGGGFKVRYKLLVYLFIASVGAWWFYDRLEFREIRIPFADNFELGIWYIPVFIFIIVASAFSANETDGLDGLLGGTSLFTFGALTAVAFALGRYDLAAFSAAIMGSLIAFLWHNIYPARFFMGDTGSMALGITMGVIAMLTNTALLLPLFAFIPVLESASVIIQMTSKKILGKKVFYSTPLHHHFEALGWHESKVTMRFWIISAMAAGLGLVIFFTSRLA